MTGWLRNGKPLKGVPKDAEGFIYMIKFADGSYYIGKKSFWSRRSKKVAGKLRRVKTVVESDWKTYKTSSKDVKALLSEGKMEYKAIILHVCTSKSCTMYMEVKEMVLRGVLCDPKSHNKNILLKLFRCVEKDLL